MSLTSQLFQVTFNWLVLAIDNIKPLYVPIVKNKEFIS